MVKTSILVCGKSLYVNNRTCNAKIGCKSKAVNLADMLASMPTAERRKLRKALHRSGMGNAASAGLR